MCRLRLAGRQLTGYRKDAVGSRWWVVVVVVVAGCGWKPRYDVYRVRTSKGKFNGRLTLPRSF